MRNKYNPDSYYIQNAIANNSIEKRIEKAFENAMAGFISDMYISIIQHDDKITVQICDVDGYIIKMKEVKGKMKYSKNGKYGNRKQKPYKKILFTREELEERGIEIKNTK